jgi:hypothetical protein
MLTGIRAACAGNCWYEGTDSTATVLLLDAMVFVEEVGEAGAGGSGYGLCSAFAVVGVAGFARLVYLSILFSSERTTSRDAIIRLT